MMVFNIGEAKAAVKDGILEKPEIVKTKAGYVPSATINDPRLVFGNGEKIRFREMQFDEQSDEVVTQKTKRDAKAFFKRIGFSVDAHGNIMKEKK